jgi:hypothetical protein
MWIAKRLVGVIQSVFAFAVLLGIIVHLIYPDKQLPSAPLVPMIIYFSLNAISGLWLQFTPRPNAVN